MNMMKFVTNFPIVDVVVVAFDGGKCSATFCKIFRCDRRKYVDEKCEQLNE